ncbi:hypothetical protein [Butyricicoccus sp.]
MKIFDSADKTMMLGMLLGTRMLNGEYVSRREFNDMIRAHRAQHNI